MVTDIDPGANAPAVTTRPLVSKDLRTFVRVVKPAINVEEIQALYARRPKPTGDAATDLEQQDAFSKEMGVYIANALLNVLDNDAIRDWIADLGGMTPEEYDNSPLDTTPQIIADLIANNDLVDFFNRAWDTLSASFGNKRTPSKNGTAGLTTSS